MPAIDNFRVNLTSVMERAGISEYALNATTGISRAYISRVKSGKVMPSLSYCEKLAVGVKVPLAFLILEQDHFERIMSQTIDKISLSAAGDLVERALLPAEQVTRPPAARTGRPPKAGKVNATEAAEHHRRLQWIKTLLK